MHTPTRTHTRTDLFPQIETMSFLIKAIERSVSYGDTMLVTGITDSREGTL